MAVPPSRTCWCSRPKNSWGSGEPAVSDNERRRKADGWRKRHWACRAVVVRDPVGHHRRHGVVPAQLTLGHLHVVHVRGFLDHPAWVPDLRSGLAGRSNEVVRPRRGCDLRCACHPDVGVSLPVMTWGALPHFLPPKADPVSAALALEQRRALRRGQLDRPQEHVLHLLRVAHRCRALARGSPFPATFWRAAVEKKVK